jgi:glutathione S-transferase
VKLYVNPMSSNARRALIVAKLTGLPVEIQVVDLAKGEHMRPSFLALNPNHKVPTLVDGDLHLWESGAICQYLAAKAGRTDLWPTEPPASGRREPVDVVEPHPVGARPSARSTSSGCSRRCSGWVRVTRPSQLAKLKEWAPEAATLDAHLAGREWVALDHLTLADIQLACTLTYMRSWPA